MKKGQNKKILHTWAVIKCNNKIYKELHYRLNIKHNILKGNGNIKTNTSRSNKTNIKIINNL